MHNLFCLIVTIDVFFCLICYTLKRLQTLKTNFMKNLNLTSLYSKLIALVLVGSMLGFMGCGDDDDDTPAPTQSIYELLSEDTDLSELKGYIDEFGLDASLKATTATTFFAPNNAAFDKLRATLGTDDLATVAPAIINSVLAFHVVPGGAFTKAQLVTEVSVATAQGESVVMNTEASNTGTIKTGGSDDEVIILEADLLATNGVMHVVETILIPPTIFNAIGVNLGKLSQPILLGSDFTTLAAGIAKADEFAAGASLTTLSSILAGTDNYTVFAPTNGTFTAGSITVDSFTGQQWYGIIANHVVPGLVAPADLVTCATFNTAAQGTLTIFNNTDVVAAKNGIGVYIDSNGDVDCTLADQGASLSNLDAEVALPNAFSASNGTLHVIAGVLVP